MRLVSGFILREIVGETVAIPTGDSAHQLSGLIALNGSGKLLFELLQTDQTEESMVQAIMEVYEVDAATAAADVSAFVAMLRENHMLVDTSVKSDPFSYF